MSGNPTPSSNLISVVLKTNYKHQGNSKSSRLVSDEIYTRKAHTSWVYIKCVHVCCFDHLRMCHRTIKLLHWINRFLNAVLMPTWTNKIRWLNSSIYWASWSPLLDTISPFAFLYPGLQYGHKRSWVYRIWESAIIRLLLQGKWKLQKLFMLSLIIL